MDDETKIKFGEVQKSITDLSSVVREDIAFRKGLDMPDRLKEVEGKVETKASWHGLYLAIGLVLALVVAAVAVTSALTKIPGQ